jgi:hypothetical protein
MLAKRNNGAICGDLYILGLLRWLLLINLTYASLKLNPVEFVVLVCIQVSLYDLQSRRVSGCTNLVRR